MPLHNVDASDVFLVSYPRSGNTWVRSIVAEIIYGRSGDRLSGISRLVPDIHVQDIDRMQLGYPRVIKSHFAYTEQYKRVIYIARDPRDVCLSYYQYVRQRNNYRHSLDRFIEEVCNGDIFPGTWHHHVMSWVFSGNHSKKDFLLIRYEDLKKDTCRTIGTISTFLGNVQGGSEEHALAGTLH
jgi:estrone sulfotransferase